MPYTPPLNFIQYGTADGDPLLTSNLHVDRDGDIFAEVLNYLRYGSIVLSVNMLKRMFLRDLDYYGIDYVGDDDAIKNVDKVVAGLKEEVPAKGTKCQGGGRET